jgi:hypothetical protein
MKIAEVVLEAAAGSQHELASFYLDALDLNGGRSESVAVEIGESRLTFVAGEPGSQPYYHFALLVPGDRFSAALEWLRATTPLLPDRETSEEVFDFDSWKALACYCLDPAGNILELIAHKGVEESGRTGPFSSGELVGFSELGLVCADKRAVVDALARELGVLVWDGEVGDPRRLAFVGERARTLILCPQGRRWLPTELGAEIHPVTFTLEGATPTDLRLPGTPHRAIGR